MISHAHVLDRKETVKRIKRNYERLCIPMDPASFLEAFAEFSEEIAKNPLIKPYIEIIAKHQEEYRQQPDIASILSKASFNPTGKQVLDQEMLKRTERKSPYFSLRIILRFNEIYDISLHERVRAELRAKNDLNDLAHFEAENIAIMDILNGNSDVDVIAFYLPHAHRVRCGIIQFFDNQQSKSDQLKDFPERIFPLEQESANEEPQTLDHYLKKKSKKQSKTPKPAEPRLVTIEILSEERKVLLSTNGKEDITFDLYQKDNPSKQTNQIVLFFEIIEKGSIPKYQRGSTLKLNGKQVERACRSVKDIIEKSWDISEYLTYDKKKGTYRISSSFPTKFKALQQ